ncbi:MAG TPA: hypothetical protein VGS08_00425 [Candidatus Saccharimonadales bacterium]|nr:hypothetical protein [Candidatus Saccharimonadales bacterium]
MTKSNDKADDSDEWARTFMAEQQKLADAEGVDLLVYMAHAHGGLLKPVVIKLLKHAKAHPDKCPDDCAFLASIRRLKKSTKSTKHGS